MGRKKISNPRIFGYRLRLNADERDALSFISEKTGLSPAKLFRKFLNEQMELLKPEKENEHGL